MDGKPSKSRESGYPIAVFGGGCFWCTEAVFQSLKGVIGAEPGYTGGTTESPTYDDVSSGRTGHVESIKIAFDPAKISYGDLLTVFFYTHDPTTLNKQGNDIGTQYASVIFYADEMQRSEAERMIAELNGSHAYSAPVVTALSPLGEFYPAESYHRDYYLNHKDDRYCEIVIAPKMEKMRMRFAELIKNSVA